MRILQSQLNWNMKMPMNMPMNMNMNLNMNMLNFSPNRFQNDQL